MDENEKEAVNFRRLQESSANMIIQGLHKEIAKWHKAMYDAYVEVGFDPEQAIELVKASVRKP